jgi:excisionase family DNA binding protein
MYNQRIKESGVCNMAQSDKLTIKAIARELDVDEKTVRRWIKTGQLKHSGTDIRGRYLVERAELEAFVKRRTEGRQE